MNASRKSLGGLLDRPWLVIGVVVLVLFTVWAIGTRTQDHHVRVAFDDAVSLYPGLDVQLNGTDVGKLGKIELEDGQAIAEVGIDDESAWPLRRGTKAGIRFGSTVGNGTRRIELFPGPDSAPAIPEDGMIGTRDTRSPTEFDEVFQTLDKPTRADIQRGQDRIRTAVQGRGQELADGVASSSRGLDAVQGLLGELASDDVALREMITHTGSVTRTLAQSADRITALMTVASQTFETFANNTSGIRRTLEAVPPTLQETRATLRRLDPSVDKLDVLMADLGPGAKALRPLAASARPAFADLRAVVPQALSTVRTARSASPGIRRLLADATPLIEKTAPVLGETAEIVSCVRPYAPEVAGFFSNWTSFTKNVDRFSSYARVRVVEGETSFNDVPPTKSSDFVNATGLTYAGLRPPGLNAGQPWFIPECGVGPDAIDPSKDWEDTP